VGQARSMLQATECPGCLADTDGRVAQALTIAREAIGWFDPLLDIASMRHETADERLFIS